MQLSGFGSARTPIELPLPPPPRPPMAVLGRTVMVAMVSVKEPFRERTSTAEWLSGCSSKSSRESMPCQMEGWHFSREPLHVCSCETGQYAGAPCARAAGGLCSSSSSDKGSSRSALKSIVSRSGRPRGMRRPHKRGGCSTVLVSGERTGSHRGQGLFGGVLTRPAACTGASETAPRRGPPARRGRPARRAPPRAAGRPTTA
eukprot:SAG25_NODE_521_length_7225_cov_3.656890_5_plen_202_part_00